VDNLEIFQLFLDVWLGLLIDAKNPISPVSKRHARIADLRATAALDLLTTVLNNSTYLVK
jgi:hypothetical protein